MAVGSRFVVPLTVTVVAVNAWPLSPRSRPFRSLQSSDASPGQCNAVALRLLPPPSLLSYQECFHEKLRANNTHDWEVPGAEIAADIECWCKYNMTGTFEQYGCCNHPEVYPMCTMNCTPDCSSTLAQECVESCPSMCFEAAEYIVDKDLCTRCNWLRCWPVVKCLTDHAEARVIDGDLQKTCAEDEFMTGQELVDYWGCWRSAPKHTSHWNILSSVVHCICREKMIDMLNSTHCCKSVLYGGGACELECVEEAECATQEAQTCIHGCQQRCPASDMTPSEECTRHCLDYSSSCRKYASCRPPSVTGHICSDGRWPEASSGCCEQEDGSFGCPKLCETQKTWRLDRRNGLPWWTRWKPGSGVVTQCTCLGCPATLEEAQEKLVVTVEEDLWDNGQSILVDVARRAGLQLGPNRRMQELMLERNRKILDVIQRREETGERQQDADAQIDAVHRRYMHQIEQAAVDFPDDGQLIVLHPTRSTKKPQKDNSVPIIITIVSCTAVLVCAVVAAAAGVVWWRKQHDKVQQFQIAENTSVVFGNPVSDSSAAPPHIQVGAPVTVQAATKGSPSNAAFQSKLSSE